MAVSDLLFSLLAATEASPAPPLLGDLTAVRRPLALSCIWVIAFLTVWHGAKLALHLVAQSLEDDDTTADRAQESAPVGSSPVESLTLRDAFYFPFFISAILLGLFILTKYFNFSVLFFIFFTLLSIRNLVWLVGVVGKIWFNLSVSALTSLSPWDWVYPLRCGNLLAIISISLLAVGNIWARNWLVTDLFALATCLNTISSLTLSSFPAACVLLTGLFLYDIWFVFGTTVIVSVAGKVSQYGPILFVVPFRFLRLDRPIPVYNVGLGLGDIVFPALFVSLALRLDLYLATLAPHKAKAQTLTPGSSPILDLAAAAVPSVPPTSTTTPSAPISSVAAALLATPLIQYTAPTPYFLLAILGYGLGLLCAFFVLIFGKHPQPALLYLVPCCIVPVLARAAVKGHLSILWNTDFSLAADEQENNRTEQPLQCEDSSPQADSDRNQLSLTTEPGKEAAISSHPPPVDLDQPIHRAKGA